ncbi:uncharacterized protein [Musca autumnalis]|uniref:uncharacterized protein n=1 Tax=Musca autumnalis TaxID=221902 RepID=UPI003CFB4B57
MGHTKLDCIKEIRSKLDMVTNLLYYEYYIPEEIEMEGDIQNLCDMLTQLYGFDLGPKGITPVNCIVAYSNFGDLPELKKIFADIPELHTSNFYENHLHLIRHQYWIYLNRHYAPYNSMAIHGVNSYLSRVVYDEQQNIVAIPLAMLQPPMYDRSYEPIFKLSSIGFQSVRNFPQMKYRGIRIIHKVQNPWENATKEECAQSVAAAAVAYKGYLHYFPQQLQPDFTGISWKQLFFLNLAQAFCVNPNQPNIEQLKEKNAQILSAIAGNLEYFSEAFQCDKKGNNAKRIEKCAPF